MTKNQRLEEQRLKEQRKKISRNLEKLDRLSEVSLNDLIILKNEKIDELRRRRKTNQSMKSKVRNHEQIFKIKNEIRRRK